ncbi:MAG: hypothetical protein COC17_04755 [Hyphomicrobiales bacterium]|nr:MAG: hypothetical protein COC17_04755 [Hyphomicrobiales bacterium]
MRYFIKLLLAMAIILLPTISHAQTLKGGSWRGFPDGYKNFKNWNISTHINKSGYGFDISCEPNKLKLIYNWHFNVKVLNKNIIEYGAPSIIIDNNDILKPDFQTIQSGPNGRRKLALNIFGHSRQIQLLEKFRTAQKSIGIRFKNGFEYTVNARGSTKAAAVFKKCTNLAKVKLATKIENKNRYNGKWLSVTSANKDNKTQAFAKQIISKNEHIKLSCKKNSPSLYISMQDKDYQSTNNSIKNMHTKIYIDDEFILETIASSKNNSGKTLEAELELSGKQLNSFLSAFDNSKENITIDLDNNSSFKAISIGNKDSTTTLRACLSKQSQ